MKHMAACQFITTTCPKGILTGSLLTALATYWLGLLSCKNSILKSVIIQTNACCPCRLLMNDSPARCLSSALLDLARAALLWGCPMCRRALSSIPALDSLAVSSTLRLGCDNQICLQTLPMCPGEHPPPSPHPPPPPAWEPLLHCQENGDDSSTSSLKASGFITSYKMSSWQLQREAFWLSSWLFKYKSGVYLKLYIALIIFLNLFNCYAIVLHLPRRLLVPQSRSFYLFFNRILAVAFISFLIESSLSLEFYCYKIGIKWLKTKLIKASQMPTLKC